MMKFANFQHISDAGTQAFNVYVFWIVSLGIIFNNVGNRTDIFITFGIMPFSFTIALGFTHP